MSKSSVKKLLASMDKSDIIAMLMEMYDARKEAKESTLSFMLHPTKMQS